jgi:two-component system NtrC family sensor kinase
MELNVGELRVYDSEVPASSDADRRFQEVRSEATVLICDDEAKLAKLTAVLLEHHGFEAATVTSADAALAALAAAPNHFDIVLLDVDLAPGRADSVLNGMRARGIAIPVLLTSGYPEDCLAPLLRTDPLVHGYLPKPYPVENLVGVIRSTLARLPN